MVDLVKLFLAAGDGGDGKVSFWRNKRVLKGGPDGGNGGAGGNIIIEFSPGFNTLQHLAGKKKYLASAGAVGGRTRKEGARGQDVTLLVPQGTVVWLVSENQVSAFRRARHGLAQLLKSQECPRQKYTLLKPTAKPPPRESDLAPIPVRQAFSQYVLSEPTDILAAAAPLTAGQLLKLAVLGPECPRLVLCQGGFGGRGNEAFKGPANTTPLEAEYGTFGEQKIIFLELQLLANVGFVGYPNAGKSSLLSRLTGARPKVANYPFTTLEPQLGRLSLPAGRSLVLADLPGLIAGASQGKGLGLAFLRHVNNTQALLFVLSLDESQIFNPELSHQDHCHYLREQLRQLLGELTAFRRELKNKQQLLVLSKIDLYQPALRRALQQEFAPENPVLVSAVTSEGLPELKRRLAQLL